MSLFLFLGISNTETILVLHVVLHPMGDRHPIPLFTLHYSPEVPMSGHWRSIPVLPMHVLTIYVGHPVLKFTRSL